MTTDQAYLDFLREKEQYSADSGFTMLCSTSNVTSLLGVSDGVGLRSLPTAALGKPRCSLNGHDRYQSTLTATCSSWHHLLSAPRQFERRRSSGFRSRLCESRRMCALA